MHQLATRTGALIALVLTLILAVPSPASAGPTYPRRIPSYVLVGVRIAADEVFDWSRCGWANYRHYMIRCKVGYEDLTATAEVTRKGWHRYLMVGKMYGIVFFREYLTF